MTEPRSLRKVSMFVLRSVVAVVLLVLAFRVALRDETGFQGIVDAWSAPGSEVLLCVIGACVIMGIGLGLNALRFRTILRGAGYASRFAPLMRAYVVSTLFAFVSPGALLGDAYRIWDVRQSTSNRVSSAIGLVVIERVLALSALGFLSLIALAIAPAKDVALFLVAPTVTLATLLASMALVCTSARVNAIASALMRPLLAPFPRLAAPLDRVLVALGVLIGQPRRFVAAFSLSLLSQVLVVAQVWVLALPLRSTIEASWFLLMVPLSTLAALLPISIGGTGVREYTYVVLFGIAGMDEPVALALSLSVLSVTLLWVLFGGLLLLAGSRRMESPMQESSDEAQ